MSTSFLLILVIAFSVGALLAAWAGIRSIQSARTVVFYRTRQARMLAGWQWLGFSLTLVLFAFGSAFFAKPLIGSLVSPRTDPTASLVWTSTSSLSRSQTITLIPTQTPVLIESATAASTLTVTLLPSVTSTRGLSASWVQVLNTTQTALAMGTSGRSTFIALLSATPTPSRTPIPTWTRTPSSTPRPTYTASPTRTPRPTWTASLTPSPVTPSPTLTPSRTASPTP